MRLEAQRLTVDCLTRLPQCPSAFTTSKRRIRTVGATKQGASINVIRLVSFRKRPPLLRGAKRSARQRSWQHCQQLGDLLRVAGGVGSNATAEAVDGRAEPVQLDVVDNEKSVVEVGHQRELKRVASVSSHHFTLHVKYTK